MTFIDYLFLQAPRSIADQTFRSRQYPRAYNKLAPGGLKDYPHSWPHVNTEEAKGLWRTFVVGHGDTNGVEELRFGNWGINAPVKSMDDFKEFREEPVGTFTENLLAGGVGYGVMDTRMAISTGRFAHHRLMAAIMKRVRDPMMTTAASVLARSLEVILNAGDSFLMDLANNTGHGRVIRRVANEVFRDFFQAFRVTVEELLAGDGGSSYAGGLSTIGEDEEDDDEEGEDEPEPRPRGPPPAPEPMPRHPYADDDEYDDEDDEPEPRGRPPAPEAMPRHPYADGDDGDDDDEDDDDYGTPARGVVDDFDDFRGEQARLLEAYNAAAAGGIEEDDAGGDIEFIPDGRDALQVLYDHLRGDGTDNQGGEVDFEEPGFPRERPRRAPEQMSPRALVSRLQAEDPPGFGEPGFGVPLPAGYGRKTPVEKRSNAEIIGRLQREGAPAPDPDMTVEQRRLSTLSAVGAPTAAYRSTPQVEEVQEYVPIEEEFLWKFQKEVGTPARSRRSSSSSGGGDALLDAFVGMSILGTNHSLYTPPPRGRRSSRRLTVPTTGDSTPPFNSRIEKELWGDTPDSRSYTNPTPDSDLSRSIRPTRRRSGPKRRISSDLFSGLGGDTPATELASSSYDASTTIDQAEAAEYEQEVIEAVNHEMEMTQLYLVLIKSVNDLANMVAADPNNVESARQLEDWKNKRNQAMAAARLAAKARREAESERDAYLRIQPSETSRISDLHDELEQEIYVTDNALGVYHEQTRPTSGEGVNPESQILGSPDPNDGRYSDRSVNFSTPGRSGRSVRRRLESPFDVPESVPMIRLNPETPEDIFNQRVQENEAARDLWGTVMSSGPNDPSRADLNTPYGSDIFDV